MTGIEVYCCYDEYGPLRVFDDGPYRYLTFGEGGEQSRIDMNNRAHPVYEYTQAMLLALLFTPAPSHATPNKELEAQPELVNQDPYGKGWLVELDISDTGELDALMSAEKYAEFIREEAP